MTSMTRTGLMVLIYWFMLSYFGVGSLRNALGGVMPAGERILALCYGVSWLALAVGGLCALRGMRRGAQVARVGAGAAVVLDCAALVMYGADIADIRSLVFLASRPIADGYLFALLSRPAAPDGTHRGKVRAAAIAAAGAILPWLAWVPARLMGGGTLALSREPGPLIIAFLCLWSALPFLFLVLAASARQDPGVRTRPLFGGIAGTVVASLYVYGLIWSQQFNVFLLALLPPVVYAGQAIGILASRFLPPPGGKDSFHTSH